jgi:hypothetical protein
MEASSGSLEEYEQQLADVEELLKESPDDATLLALKTDLVELVTLTRGEVATNNNNNETAPEEEPAAQLVTKKKPRAVKEFEIPPRFLPLDTDTEAEANKKKRAIKSLKRQHRATVKEAESDKKQKTWQSFQKKKKLKDGSIFSTHDDDDVKIGVVTSRKKTSFHDRTRHK